MKECPYTASSRDVSENTPPSALEISLVRGFCTPRPSRLPSGFALGQSLGPRGAKSPPLGNLVGLGECIFQYIPPLGSVRIQYQVSLAVQKKASCSRLCKQSCRAPMSLLIISPLCTLKHSGVARWFPFNQIGTYVKCYYQLLLKSSFRAS